MTDFLYTILNSDISDLLGDFYTPVCAAVVASWSIIGVGGAVSAFVEIIRSVCAGFAGGRS